VTVLEGRKIVAQGVSLGETARSHTDSPGGAAEGLVLWGLICRPSGAGINGDRGFQGLTPLTTNSRLAGISGAAPDSVTRRHAATATVVRRRSGAAQFAFEARIVPGAQSRYASAELIRLASAANSS
jgi:hypothetical protein